MVAHFPVPTEEARALAEMATLPAANGAAVIEQFGKQAFGEQDVGGIFAVLEKSIGAVQGGNMEEAEAMLISQAHALQSIFCHMSRRVLSQEYQKNLESFFRMAMKAQNQCRMTLETLAAIKNPPVIYAKQANIAHGPQQVNNEGAGRSAHTHAHTGKTINQQNELLGDRHGNYLDTGTAGEAASHDPALAALGEINRAEVGRG